MVSGHNDAELARDLEKHGESGHLQGKYLLLNTCVATANAANFSRLIERYGAVGILNHGKPILPEVLRPVLKAMVEILEHPPAEGIHPADLMRQSVERDMKDRLLPQKIRDRVRDLSFSFVQISVDDRVSLQRLGRRAA